MFQSIGKKFQWLDVINISHRPVWHLCLLSLKESSLFPVTVLDAALMLAELKEVPIAAVEEGVRTATAMGAASWDAGTVNHFL